MSLLKNSTLYLISNLFLKGAGFLLLPLYTTLISPEEFGVIFLIQLTASLITAIVSISIRAAISRFYFDCKSKYSVKLLYSTIVWFILFLSTIIYIVIFIFATKLAQAIEVPLFPYFYMGMLTSFFALFYPLITALLYVKQEGVKISIISIVSGFILLSLNVILVINLNDKIFAFLLAGFISSVINFIIFLFYSKNYIILKFDKSNIYKYIKYSLFQLPSDLSGWIITFSDRLLINKMLGAFETGIYSVGYKIGNINQVVYQSLNKAYVPFVYSKYKDLTVENHKSVSNVALYFFTLYSFIGAIICVFHKELIFLIDERYSNSAIIMLIILVTYIFDSYRLIFNNPLGFNTEFVKYKSIVLLFSAALNISLNLILIPYYSIIGAAIATLITVVIKFLLIFFLANKAIKINYDYKKFAIVFFVSFLFIPTSVIEISFVGIITKLVFSIIFIITLIRIIDFNWISLKKLIIKY